VHFVQANLLPLSAIALQALLVLMLSARRLNSRGKFPIFMAYGTFALTGNVVAFLLRHTARPYFYAYWLLEFGCVMLGLCVVCEVFMRLLGQYAALHKLARLVFQWTVVALVLTGAVVWLVQPVSNQGVDPVYHACLVVEECARILEVGLLMFLFVFAGIFGVHWRQHVFGIALGLGIFAAVELIGGAVYVYLGPGATGMVSVARAIAFDVGVLVWLGYLMVPQRAASHTEVPDLARLEQWNKALTELIYQ
jgi:hypothetical protein